VHCASTTNKRSTPELLETNIKATNTYVLKFSLFGWSLASRQHKKVNLQRAAKIEKPSEEFEDIKRETMHTF